MAGMCFRGCECGVGVCKWDVEEGESVHAAVGEEAVLPFYEKSCEKYFEEAKEFLKKQFATLAFISVGCASAK